MIRSLSTACMVVTCFATVTAADSWQGRLEAGDQQLPSGEYLDRLTVPARAGERIRLELRGTGFDAYLIVIPPEGGKYEIDDSDGMGTDCAIDHLALMDGDLTVVVTSNAARESGAWRLNARRQAPQAVQLALDRSGTLSASDPKDASQRPHQRFPVNMTAGTTAVLRMTGTGCDPFVQLLDPRGTVLASNDDAVGFGLGSQLEHQITETGTYTVIAASADAKKLGEFRLMVAQLGTAQPATAAANTQGGDSWSGRLEAGDAKLSGGEFYDDLEVPVAAGERLRLELRGVGFDPYLIAVVASGGRHEVDDSPGMGTDCTIDHLSLVDGVLRVRVTSANAGEVGAWTLNAIRQPAQPIEILLERSGKLVGTDPADASGRPHHRIPVALVAGTSVVFRMTGQGCDPHLTLLSPGGSVAATNDDITGFSLASQIEFDVPESGTWTLLAATAQAEKLGAYRVHVARLGPARTQPDGQAQFSGRLEAGDRTLSSGEWIDEHRLPVRAGERVVVELTSEEFDPYLIVKNTDGSQLDNDDHEGSRTRSLLTITAAGDGELRLMATSYRPKMGGAYRLTTLRSAAGATASTSATTERGTLAAGDATLKSGEFHDTYRVQGQPGQVLRVRLTSNDFDPYLIVVSPSGEQTENDDAEGLGTGSQVTLPISELGEHRIIVTSYASGSTGAYELTWETLAVEADSRSAPRPASTAVVQLGTPVRGALANSDERDEAGRFRDTWMIETNAGQELRFDLIAEGFDCTIAVELPDGTVLTNDDFEGRPHHSRVDARVPRDGRCRIAVSSYGTGVTGAYALTVTTVDRSATADTRSGGRVRGIFVGITDYPGDDSDLPYCAEDATRVAQALSTGARMRSEDAIILRDSEATLSNLRRAFQRMAQICQPDDTLVLFFSGHGSRHDRPNGPQPADPDGVDESLVLVDGVLLDDALHDLLTPIRAGTQLIAIDACFAGGFAKDVICVPGRMGLFSSEEDVPSNVAAKFRAGGYLSLFLANAVAEHLADADSNGQISAIELCQYVREQYRAQVKSSGPGSASAANFVRASDLGFQHLVVDRGSVPHDHALFSKVAR